MFLKHVKKNVIIALILAAAWVAPVSGGVSAADIERLSESGTASELEAALSGLPKASADVVFPSGNNPLHVAAEYASDPAVIDVLVKHGTPLSSEGLEKLTPLMLAAAYNPSASITEALIGAGAAVNSADRQGRTPLHLAAASNGAEVVDVLLKNGAAANARDRSGKTPLWVAANRSNAGIVKLLLDAGARAEEPNDDGITPLLVASEQPDAAVLRFLVEAGANPNVRGTNRYTPFMSAVAAGAKLDAVLALIAGGADVSAEDDQNRSAIHLLASRTPSAEDAPEIIDALVNAGASPNAMDSSLVTPLMEACKNKNAALVEALLEAGAGVELRDRNSWTPLLHAASNGAPLEIYKLLKKAGAGIDDCTRKGISPLMAAIESKVAAEGIKALLDAGADPNYKGYDSVSALMSAVAARDAETLKLMLEYGADPNQATWDGLSPMMLAAQTIHDKAMFDILTAGGANADSQSSQGVTALMVAASSGNITAIESLTALSADLEIKDIDGFSPLFHAVQSSDENEYTLEAIDLLIEKGSNVNARDATGAVPLMHAALVGDQDIAEKLIDAGAIIYANDTVGWTALHFAARSLSGADVTALLVKNFSRAGKSVDVPDNGGTTPLMVAASHNNPLAVRLLLEAGASFSLQDKTGRSAYEYAVMKNAAGAQEAIKEAMDATPMGAPRMDEPRGEI